MTSQFSSEQDLFDLSDNQVETPKRHRKRLSLGPRLPVNPHSPKMAEEKKGNGKGPGVGSGSPSRQTGSMLGFGGMSFSQTNSLVLEGNDKAGNKVSTNVFTDIFVNGLPNEQLERLLNYLHAEGKLEFSTFIEGISYQGFDRLYYIRAALKKVSVETFCKFAILGAVRGSNFKKITESCLSMPPELTRAVDNGLVIKKASKRDDLTILRFTASIPHWVAFWLFTANMPKKIESEACPGWLQFPGAASLPMGKKQRLEHISFCKAFSSLLPGGSFNGNIYFTAYSNQIPISDIPSMIKDGLGIGRSDTTSGTISSGEVQEATSRILVKA